MPDLPAHVLRLDHAPVAAALKAADGVFTFTTGAVADVSPFVSRARVILGLDPCPLCAGSRVCPDCGQPCEVCTVVGGSRRVIP